MKIDLRKLEEGVNEFSFDESSADLQLGDASVDFASPIQTRFNVVRVGESLTASGSTSFAVRHECVRCLKSFKSSFSVDFGFILQKGEPNSQEEAEAEAIIWIKEEAGLLDLSDEIRDHVLLEIPMNPVCSDDCVGLCPSCGKNLNTDTCTCTGAPGDSRWDALRELNQ